MPAPNINNPLINHSIGSTSRSSIAFKFLLFWIFVSIGRPQDIFPFLKTLHLGDISALGALIFLLAIPPDQKNRNIFKYTEVRLFTLLFVLMIVLIPFALVKTESLNFVKGVFLKTYIFFILSVTLIRTVKDIKLVSLALLLSMLSLSTSVFHSGDQASVSISGRYSVGTMYDPNDLAMVIVTILPVAMMYGFHSKGIQRLFGIGASIIGILGITLTQSRGGFLGLVAITLLIFFSRSRFKIKYLVVLLILGAVFVSYAPTEYWGRIKTITDDEDRGSERTVVWKRSLHMLSRNPLGYGVNNFQSAYGRYVENLDNPEDDTGGYQVYAWRTAHNSFILIAVELGIVGLAIFIFLIYNTYNNFRKIKKIFTSDTLVHQHAEFFRISLVGFLVCAFFLSQSYAPLLYLFFAVSSVMKNVIIRETESNRDQEKLNFDREGNNPGNHVHPVKKLL